MAKKRKSKPSLKLKAGITRSEVQRITGLSDPTIRKYRHLGIFKITRETNKPGVRKLYVYGSIPVQMRRNPL